MRNRSSRHAGGLCRAHEKLDSFTEPKGIMCEEEQTPSGWGIFAFTLERLAGLVKLLPWPNILAFVGRLGVLSLPHHSC